MSISISTFKRKSPLIGDMRQKLREARMSIRTEDAYIHWACDYIAWSKWKHPKELAEHEVTDYLSHLAVDRKVAASTQNQAFSALLFLYSRVLEKPLNGIDAKRAKRPANVPELLSREELKAIFDQLSGDYQLLARLAYGSGMRLLELLRLRIKDVDFGNRMITVRRGKGQKDRAVPLPQSLVKPLLERIAQTRQIHETDLSHGFGEVWLPEALEKKVNAKAFLWQYVFSSRKLCVDPRDGKTRRHHLFETGFQAELAKAGQRARINKRVHAHAIRHSFATHFLENGGSLQQLQQLLGHKDVRTTMIYLHCMDASHARSPLDVL